MVLVVGTAHTTGVAEGAAVARECLPNRRSCWRQKLAIVDEQDGSRNVFYVDFGEHPDGRLAELFIAAKRGGTFVCGVLDTLARTASLALQNGSHPHEVAKMMRGMNYPPQGTVVAAGSSVEHATSIADYIAQEIVATYGDDGRQRVAVAAEPDPKSDSDPDSGTLPA